MAPPRATLGAGSKRVIFVIVSLLVALLACGWRIYALERELLLRASVAGGCTRNDIAEVIAAYEASQGGTVVPPRRAAPAPLRARTGAGAVAAHAAASVERKAGAKAAPAPAAAPRPPPVRKGPAAAVAPLLAAPPPPQPPKKAPAAAVPAERAVRVGGNKAVKSFSGPIVMSKRKPQIESFPSIKLTPEEVPFIGLADVNVNTIAEPLPAGALPLSTLPFPPGMPSVAAYTAALSSKTFKLMERFSTAFLRANKELVDQYQWSRDPLHSWSRRYEYVWVAEALRALLPLMHAKTLEETWPTSPAPADIEFDVLDIGSGFTFLDQFLGSRLGVRVVALDQERSYIPFFGGLTTSLFAGERDVPPIPYVQARIESSGLPSNSFDVITCVSVLELVNGEDLALMAKEFKRVLKRGGRLLITFATGEPPIARSAAQSKVLLDTLRLELVEDTSHGAPPQLLARDGGPAQALFTNRKATPIEFNEALLAISAHVFINP